MIKSNLIPRLNYNYSFFDLLFSVYSIRKKGIPEQEMHRIFDSKNIFFTNHARTGLRILLSSLNLAKNSRIGVQAYNCYTVFQAIKQAGFYPFFIDIDNHFNLSIKDLKKKNHHIDALIVTHTFGIPADFDEIKSIAGGIPIIEDCAHSFLSKYKNKLTGKLGDASIFSFGNAKFPSIGSGGFVLINNNRLLKKFKKQYQHLQDYSMKAELVNIFKNYLLALAHKKPLYGLVSYPLGKKLDNKYDFAGKFSFDEANCYKSNKALFFKKLGCFEKYLQKQRSNAEFLIAILKHNYHTIEDDRIKQLNYFMVPFLTKKRDEIIKNFYSSGIEISKHFENSIEWAKYYDYETGDCLNAEGLIKNVVAVPCHYNYPQNGIFKLGNLLRHENTN